MKWVKVNSIHINTDKVLAFRWISGVLYVWYVFAPEPVGYEDPHGENYGKLCRVLGVLPEEVEARGKS